MPDSNPDVCSRCGGPRSVESPAGLCPRCLIGKALDSDANVTYSFVAEEPGKVLETLALAVGPMPHVLLPDTAEKAVESAVVKPSSEEMPPKADRSSRVQLLGEIARGGMGAVLKGRDPDLGRDLAVKVLLDAHRDKPEMIRRFVEEAQIGGQLQHPGVVPVYELGTFGDSRPYFTMKLVKGRTFAEILAERTQPSVDRPRFVAMLLQVAQTVAYAHARGVIHRDLKPSNIMVGSFGEVQVMDWGLAKVLPRGGVKEDARAGLELPMDETLIATSHPSIDPDGDFSRAGSIVGTPSYMAPEQARGETDRVDERADVFALGSILAEILTGQPAFTGRSGIEILRKAARGDLLDAFARLDGSGADAALVDLARACLAADPDDRPAQAQEVADRLLDHINSLHQRLREAELAQAAEHARAEEAKRTAAAESARAEEAQRAAESAEARARAERRARRLQVGLAASLIGLMTLGGGGFAWFQQQRSDRLARTARTVEEALADAARLEGEAQAAPPGETAKWAVALSAAKRAEGLLAQGEADASLKGRVVALLDHLNLKRADAAEKAGQLETDRVLLAELEMVRGNRADAVNLKQIDADYAVAFRKAGLDLDKTEPADSGKWLKARSEPVELAGYLDDWAFVRRTTGRTEADWRRLVSAARAADPHQWRNALRAKAGTKDAGAIEEFRRLADDEDALDAQPAMSLILLAAQLKDGAGDRERAARVLRRAVSRHPAEYWAQIELGQVHGTPSGRAREIYPKPEEAVRHLTAAVAIRPRSLSPHINLGNALYVQGKLDQAVAEFREAIRLKPDYAGAHSSLGAMLQAQGKIDEAVAECREAIRLYPDGAQSHTNLGAALQVQGKLDETVAECREAIRLQPENAQAHAILGNVLGLQGKLDEAVAECREAMRLRPDDTADYVNLGNVLGLQGKLDQAETAFRMAIRLQPDHVTPHFNLALALGRQGKLDEAVAELREAIRLKPDYAAAHANLGFALTSQGKPDEAVTHFREAARLQPDDAAAHANLGNALGPQGKLDEAAAELREAIRLKPGQAVAQSNLGNILRALGKLDESVVACREAIRLKPDYAEAHCNLGLALRSQGDYVGSLAMFRRGHELGTQQPGWRYPSAQWVAEAERLATVAERLAALADRLPALLKGEDRPKDVPERLALARICYDKKFHAAAARFWAEALEADPRIGENRQAGHRYNAACAAALAAAGQGKDDPPPDDAAKAKLRGQALDWLKTELDTWAKVLDAGPAQLKARVAPTLQHWKTDADLAGIRDPEPLSKLPEDEQKAWRSVWEEVDALRKKAEQARP
jgi:eukaryotic-like serine/threonine-protein kinase